MMKNLFGFEYDDLWKALIRPPKEEYSEYHLGAKDLTIDGVEISRTDLILKNKRNLKLECSVWEPKNKICERLPCVVYLHGNSGSRVEAAQLVKYLVPYNIILFGFDFSGCGKSEGEYISLGYYEKEDVEVVVKYLRSIVKFF
jgi:cephalosporin-C deacetylase-like acetyl esterase